VITMIWSSIGFNIGSAPVPLASCRRTGQRRRPRTVSRLLAGRSPRAIVGAGSVAG
jgi:hypothetical protein